MNIENAKQRLLLKARQIDMTGVILPPATIGIIGGGQLGQMMALSAKEMGYRVGILDPTKGSPAGQVSDFQIVADYDDVEALNELSRRSEVLTYEFENVDRDALNEQSDAELPQGTELLRITSDRITEKKFIRDDAKVPVTNFIEVNSPEDLRKVTLPAILKTVSGGYDGHGQWSINTVQDIVNLEKDFPDMQLILEQVVNFKQELSIMVSRSQDGQIVTWPIVENVHENHILKTTTAPADISLTLKNKIEAIAENIAESLKLRGVLGIELFVADEEVWVNELAPRPHNSGHYSIEATNVSQFEGHVRSIVGLPIPKIELQNPATMLNLLGDELTQAREDLIHHPEWHFHDYGKLAVKLNRKMGHITVLGTKMVEN